MTRSNPNRIIKNTAYLYGKTLITMFTSLWATRIILSSLGTVDFGIYDVVAGSIAMLGFLNLAMANTIQRYLNHAQGEGDLEKQKYIFNAGIVFHSVIAILIAAILLILMIILFNGILNIPQERIFAAKITYLCLVVSTLFTILGVPYDAALNAHEDMLYYSIIGVVESFLRLGVAFVLVYTTQDKLLVYAILMALIPISSMNVMRYYCKHKYEECVFRPRVYYKNDIAREILSFAGWNLMGTTSGIIGNHGNSIVLNHFYGAALNAVAGIANQLQGMMMVLSAGMMKALNPVIFKAEGEGDIKKMMNYSYKGCKYSFLLLGLLAFPMIYETPMFLKIWLKEVPDWSVTFVRLQLVRAMLEQLTIPLERSLQAVGHIKEINLLSFLFNLLPVIFLSLLYSRGFLPYWHFVVAITMMVVIPGVAKIVYCYRYCNLKMADYLGKVLFPCLSVSFLTTGCWLVIFIMKEENLVRLIMSCGSAILFCIFSYLFMDQEEKKYVTTLIQNTCRVVLKHK